MKAYLIGGPNDNQEVEVQSGAPCVFVFEEKTEVVKWVPGVTPSPFGEMPRRGIYERGLGSPDTYYWRGWRD